LKQLAVKLEAVVQMRVAKEEKVFLPLFEQYAGSALPVTGF